MSELQPPNTVSQSQSEEELKANLEQNLERSVEIEEDNNDSSGEAKQYIAEKNNQKPWLGLLLFISVAINGVVLSRVFSPAEQVNQPAAATVKTPPPRPVEVTTLATGNATSSVQLLGQVESPQQATIRAQTGGVIKNILVQAGDRVTPGKTIAILDDADQKLALSRAEAQLAQQRNNLARLEEGTRPEIIAQRQAAVSAAQAREREAADNYSRRAE